jgi:hypothetical protein
MKLSELIAELEGLRRDAGDVLVEFKGKWAVTEADPWTEWVGWRAAEAKKAAKKVKAVAKKSVSKHR